MKTNPDLLCEIPIEEMIELRTPDPSQCIYIKYFQEKWNYAQRVIPLILKHFKGRSI